MSFSRNIAAGVIAAFEIVSSHGYAGAEPVAKSADELCGNKKSCRPLTPAEIKLASSVFGKKIRYSDVRVLNSPLSIVTLFASATTFDSNIRYYEPKLHAPDHARAPLLNRRFFLHEMTHVWQYQNGMDVRLHGLANILRYPMNYNAAYPYKIGKSFHEYRMEQQAKIVEDYYVLKVKYADIEDQIKKSSPSKRPALGKIKKSICDGIGDRYDILAPHFPLQRHACNKN